jgi:hypothetical protein
LIHEGLIPAVDRMVASFEPASTPYRALLDALLAYLAPRAVRRRNPPKEARP